MYHVLLDLVFPRICLCCREGTADKMFCTVCWELLALPDPAERCRHCFTLAEEEVCKTCCKVPALCFPRVYVFDESLPAWILQRKISEAAEALAGFALVFWHRLEWDLPDLIVPVPDQNGSKAIFQIANIFSKLIERPCRKVLHRTYSAFLRPDLALKAKEKEEQKILLFDLASDVPWLKKASAQIAETFPNRVRVFSLFHIGNDLRPLSIPSKSQFLNHERYTQRDSKFGR